MSVTVKILRVSSGVSRRKASVKILAPWDLQDAKATFSKFVYVFLLFCAFQCLTYC